MTLHFASGMFALIAGLLAALAMGAAAGRGRRRLVLNAVGDVLVAALVAARIGFVALYFPHYWAAPLGILDIRDGGFDPVAGLLGGTLFVLVRLYRQPGLRRPLGLAAVAGVLAWGGVLGALTLIERQTFGMPEVALRELGGNNVLLPRVAPGQPRVVNLWASWCPPCVQEMPVLAEAERQHPDIAFVFVNQGEHRDAVRQFLRRHQLALDNVLLDETAAIGRITGNRALPTTLFYDSDGRLVNTHRGLLSAATLARALERFAEAEPPPRQAGVIR